MSYMDDFCSKGFLISILSPSQMGKDKIAEMIIDNIDGQASDEEKRVTYPTVYKIRKRRVNDKDYIKTVEKEEEIPEEFDLRYKVNQDQVIAYSSEELMTKINNGQIPIIVTASVELVEKLKEIYKGKHIDIKILGALPSEKKLEKEEIKRFGGNYTEAVQESIENRLNYQEKNAKQIEEHNSDLIFRNHYTISKYLATGKYATSDAVEELVFDIFNMARNGQDNPCPNL